MTSQVSANPLDRNTQPARKAPGGRVYRKVFVLDLQRSTRLPWPAAGDLALYTHLGLCGGDLRPCAHKVHAGVVVTLVVHHFHIWPSAQAHANLHRCVLAVLLGRRAGRVVVAEDVELVARII